eukprot:s104_g33.t2
MTLKSCIVANTLRGQLQLDVAAAERRAASPSSPLKVAPPRGTVAAPKAFVPRWATPGYSTPAGPPGPPGPPMAMAAVVATPAPLAAPMAGYLTPSGPLTQCHAPEREISGPPQGLVRSGSQSAIITAHVKVPSQVPSMPSCSSPTTPVRAPRSAAPAFASPVRVHGAASPASPVMVQDQRRVLRAVATPLRVEVRAENRCTSPDRRAWQACKRNQSQSENLQKRQLEPTTPITKVQVPVPLSGATPREVLERDLSDPEKVEYDDLQFIERLGKGEFGEVFRGYYGKEEVAIKQLFFDENMTELIVQDLAREIDSFRHLSHKRLVRFIGASLQLPNLCLVTEYMPGGSLHHLLHVRRQKLPFGHALNMCIQIADGVSYLHSQIPTIVHRDLKSLNVVLDLSLNIKVRAPYAASLGKIAEHTSELHVDRVLKRRMAQQLSALSAANRGHAVAVALSECDLKQHPMTFRRKVMLRRMELDQEAVLHELQIRENQGHQPLNSAEPLKAPGNLDSDGGFEPQAPRPTSHGFGPAKASHNSVNEKIAELEKCMIQIGSESECAPPQVQLDFDSWKHKVDAADVQAMKEGHVLPMNRSAHNHFVKKTHKSLVELVEDPSALKRAIKMRRMEIGSKAQRLPTCLLKSQNAGSNEWRCSEPSICDFGLTESMDRTHITKKNNGGSPRYMAPELFDCKTKITEKIDVWAMGCIFVEVCGGPLPYEKITTLAELTKEMLIKRRTPSIPEFITGPMRDVCKSCLSFHYQDRPSSQRAFELLKAAKKAWKELQ